MIDCCRTTLNFLRKSFYDLNTVVKKWSARRKRNLVGSLFAQSSCVLRLNRPSRVGTASNLCSVMLDDVAPSPHMPEHEQYIFSNTFFFEAREAFDRIRFALIPVATKSPVGNTATSPMTPPAPLLHRTRLNRTRSCPRTAATFEGSVLLQ